MAVKPSWLGQANNGGNKLFTVSGDVERPVTMKSRWAPLSRLLLELCGGVRGGKKLKAVIPGGSSSPVIPAHHDGTTMDYDSIASRLPMLGSGAVIVMDETRCMVKSLQRLSHFYMHESLY